MKNISDEICRETRNTYFMFNNFFFLNRAIYETKLKKIVERGRPQMTIWRTPIACWILKATNTPTGCVIYITCPVQQWSHKRSSLLQVHCLSSSTFITVYLQCKLNQQNSTFYKFLRSVW